MIVHDNERYTVWVTRKEIQFHGITYEGCYCVRNKETGQTEHYAAQLPDAIHMAEALNHAMESKAWKWLAPQKEELGPSRLN